MANTNTLVTQLETGEVQMTDGLGAPEYDLVKEFPDHDVVLLTGNNWQHIDLKNIGWLMDKRVRQALDYATPRQQIVEQLLKGLGEVASGDQGPTTFYYNPDITPRPYDLEKGSALLTEAGFAKTPTAFGRRRANRSRSNIGCPQATRRPNGCNRPWQPVGASWVQR